MNWIKTIDRLPKENFEEIIFTDGKDIYKGHFSNSFSKSTFSQIPPEDQLCGDTFILDEITHWMPLPELPIIND